ncbi:MAG: N-acetylmuramoyl-L-alanine amidase-like domain-containing protein [Bacteroidota bacterium]
MFRIAASFFYSILILLLLCQPLWAQLRCTARSQALCESYLSGLKDCDPNQPIGQIAIEVGQRMMGTPYVGGTLENPEGELLTVDLEGLDCTTFLENVVVMSRLVQQKRLDFESFQAELTRLRYRGGALQGYDSRLHYFSDWIYDNTQKGIVQDVTQAIGGESYPKTIDFMGTHRQAYAALSDDQLFASILQTEQALNQRKHFFIPKAKVAALDQHIEDGDLIAITTTVKGLDVSHVGIAIHHQGRLHLLHASTDQKEVVISKRPLAEYLAGNRSQSGIMVARLLGIN